MNLKTDKANRALLFWGVCIPVRILITVRAMHDPYVRIPAAGVAYMWLSGSHSDAVEGAFGGHAWWAEERRAHGLLWAYYAATGYWQLLALDTACGGVNWLTSSKGIL